MCNRLDDPSLNLCPITTCIDCDAERVIRIVDEEERRDALLFGLCHRVLTRLGLVRVAVEAQP